MQNKPVMIDLCYVYLSSVFTFNNKNKVVSNEDGMFVDNLLCIFVLVYIAKFFSTTHYVYSLKNQV